VINYEEGAENCLLHGDKQSEHLLSEIIGVPPYKDARHLNMESLYDYGTRAGFWRIRRALDDRNVPATVFGCGMALERHPEAVSAMVKSGWEVSSHGYRWIDYQDVDEATERSHIKATIAVHEKMVGAKPAGIYQGKPNLNTRKIVVEEGFL
jgi:peptidoglycan/xylan/chitin deacetylase (PgdA/CDA1 family)